MKKYVLENVTKLTDEKYLNFYKLHYKSENEKQNYYDYVISSRRDIKNISANNRYTKKAMQNRKENMEDSK